MEKKNPKKSEFWPFEAPQTTKEEDEAFVQNVEADADRLFGEEDTDEKESKDPSP